jgi:hypothetical protein
LASGCYKVFGNAASKSETSVRTGCKEDLFPSDKKIQKQGEDLLQKLWKLFKSILKLISKTIPIAFLRSVPADDEGMRGLSFRDDHESSVIMKVLVNYFFKQRVEAGDSLLSIKETLEYLQPFCDYPDIIEEIYYELQQPSTSKPQD